ncbi:unnamed protein product [Boreogadus saida]
MSKGGTGMESPLLQALWLITQTQEIQAYDGQTQQTMLDMAAHHAEESVVFHDLQRRMTRQVLRIVLPTIGAGKDILEAFLELEGHLLRFQRLWLGRRAGSDLSSCLSPGGGGWLLPGERLRQQVVEQVTLEQFLQGLLSSAAEWNLRQRPATQPAEVTLAEDQ